MHALDGYEASVKDTYTTDEVHYMCRIYVSEIRKLEKHLNLNDADVAKVSNMKVDVAI